jgi:hypothetical protein
MSDIHIIQESLFANKEPGDAGVRDGVEQSNLPLSVRIGYAAPPGPGDAMRASDNTVTRTSAEGLLPTLPPIVLSTGANGSGFGYYGSGGYYYGTDGNLYPGGYYYSGG